MGFGSVSQPHSYGPLSEPMRTSVSTASGKWHT